MPDQSSSHWAKVFETEMRARLGADGSHDIGHFRRVWKHAQAIAREEGGDRDVLAAAAFLHDLVNPPKSSPDRPRASALSAEAAAPVLRAHGFPEDRIAEVQHAILTHSFSAGIAPETLEARILQDADRLDALGAIGIARCFNVSGQMGGGLFDPDDPLAHHRLFDDRAYALDHFETKLYRIAETLHTKTARSRAETRVSVMKRFVDDLLSELT
ncbi:MAG: HD domain-containing protein [Paracoccaceae bacterium]